MTSEGSQKVPCASGEFSECANCFARATFLGRKNPSVRRHGPDEPSCAVFEGAFGYGTAAKRVPQANRSFLLRMILLKTLRTCL